MIPELRRVRAHLEGALDLLSLRDVSALDEPRRGRRSAAARALRAYTEAERYPHNHVLPTRTPVFVDEHGTRCAVAHLLDETGHRDLVRRIAATRNLARVHELADEPELVAWLDHHGITLDEAARIQPSYSAHDEIDWRPAAAVLAMADLGSVEGSFRATLSPAVRLGVRRNVHHQAYSGTVTYSAFALLGEYRLEGFPGLGLSHRVSALAQWDPSLNTRDAQWYLLGGAHYAFDADAHPGGGPGAQLAVGFSFRRRTIPWMAELGGDVTARESAVAYGFSLRVGVGL